MEGYIEPRTTTNPTTLLLVDRDGDHARAPVRDPQQGRKFCERHGIPVYDAQVIGYPKRMRDFERRRGRGPDADLDKEIADLERRLREAPGRRTRTTSGGVPAAPTRAMHRLGAFAGIVLPSSARNSIGCALAPPRRASRKS